MTDYRLYIDESGDHTYRYLSNLDQRYLGLTGVLIRKNYYDSEVPNAVETLKRKHFRYDIDYPPILVRSHIRSRKRWFGILQDPTKNAKWEDDLLTFLKKLEAKIFTVVMDKAEHKAKYPVQTFDPYDYCLSVLLWRVRGYCKVNSGTVDVLAESRGKVEDRQIQETYRDLKNYGSHRYGTAEEYSTAFPADTLLFRRKEHNIAGLQIADLVAFGQKV